MRVRKVQLQGELEEVRYRKRDDGRFYEHTTEHPTDLWLVDVDGRRGTLALPRGGGPGWTRDGDTTWLTNPPERRSMTRSTKRSTKRSSKKTHTKRRIHQSARRRSTRRRGTHTAKRRPPAGFATWSAYMASIRPNPRGGHMAAKKRRRRRHTRRPAVRRHAPNPPKRRRHYRRNPAFRMGGIVGRITDAGKGAVFMVGGEGVTRYVRSQLLKMADGTTTASLADAGIGIGLGMATEKFVSRQAGRDVTAGVFAYLLRGIAKQLGVAQINAVLGDPSGVRRFVVRDGKVVPLNGNRLSGYVGRGNGALSGYVGRGNGAAATLSGEEDLGY